MQGPLADKDILFSEVGDDDDGGVEEEKEG